MNTFHLSLDVPDLDGAVGFYRELFGQEPAKLKDGYAKFELTDPPVALALNASKRAGINHLGIRVDSTDDVLAASARLKEGGLATFDERDTTAATRARTRSGCATRRGTPGRSTRSSTTPRSSGSRRPRRAAEKGGLR